MTETSSIQNRGLESGSLIVGRVRPPMAMWSALEGIASTTAVRHGVLIIFSQNVRGRLGIFCNRYISGAIIESTGVVGLEAVRTLLAIKSGMFGFRACIGDEWTEVGKQSLGLDLHELLIQRNPDEGAETALRALMMPGSQLVRGSDLPINDDGESIMGESLMGDGSLMGGDLSPPMDLDSDKTFEPVEAETESTSDSNFSYLDWFADQMGQRDELPKFRQILMTAAPAAPPLNLDADTAPSQSGEMSFEPGAEAQPADNDVKQYGRLLRSEQEKVIRDIERSLERGRTADGGANLDDAVDDLRMLQEFIESEKELAQRWEGLDSIPTPKVDVMHSGAHTTAADVLRVSQRMTAVNFEAEAAKTAEPGAPPARIDVARIDTTVHWYQLPAVIGLVVTLAFGLIAYAIMTHQANSTFQATLADARRGLRENPAAAAKVLTKAIESQPGNARGYFYRGIAFGAAGEYEKSVQDLNTAFLKGEQFTLVELSKAASACRAAQYTDAITACDSVLKREPNNSQAKSLRKLAEDLQKAAQPPSVVATPAEDKTEEPKKGAPHRSAALDKSIIADALPSTPTKLPSDPKKLIQLGYEALRAGQTADATDLFTEAVRRAPNDPAARRYLAHTLAESGSKEAAASQFSALVSLRQMTSRDVLKYAEVLQALNKTSTAAQMLAHFMQSMPNDLPIRTELIRLYSDNNQKEAADALYNASLPLATTPAAKADLDYARGGGDDNATIHIRR